MPHLPYFKFVQYIMMSARDLLPPFTQRPFTGNTDKPFVSAEYPLINFNICLKMIRLIFSLNIEIRNLSHLQDFRLLYLYVFVPVAFRILAHRLSEPYRIHAQTCVEYSDVNVQTLEQCNRALHSSILLHLRYPITEPL